MASLSSDDRAEKSGNGTIKRLHENSTRASGGFGDEQTVADSEQTLADSEQTLADTDQSSVSAPGTTACRPLSTAGRRRGIARPRRQTASGNAGDRLQALADREALARALAITEIDPLTGARARAAGLADLDRELDRSRRTGSILVIVYVDVVGLKKLNDSEGHEVGDQLLKRVVALITAHLRPYDLVVRLAGDEFLCAMSNMTLTDARRRLSAIAATLSATRGGGALRTGFAELTGDETATELLARADSQLLDTRREQ